LDRLSQIVGAMKKGENKQARSMSKAGKAPT
jgi:hypothetical protein